MALKIGINHVNNAEYHADQSYLSSSNLKLLLKDREKFYKEKILGEREKKESTVFDEGSLTHSLILEPDIVHSEFAFYNGLRKQGEDFERFKLMHQGKTIISKPQLIRCNSYKAAFEKNPVAVELLAGGLPEHTVCQNLSDVPVKIRCDYINVEKGFIADIKTTSYPADVDTFRVTVSQFGYDLSSALYTTVASQFYGKNFDFYFIVIDKKNLVCEVYKASEATLAKGRLQVAEALSIYKHCKETGNWSNEPIVLTKQTKYEILEV